MNQLRILKLDVPWKCHLQKRNRILTPGADPDWQELQQFQVQWGLKQTQILRLVVVDPAAAAFVPAAVYGHQP